MEKYLSELLRSLINQADEALPGKTGQEKEDWVAERLLSYIEVHDAAFFRAVIAFTRLPIPGEIIDGVVDNKLADAWQKRVVSVVCKTAVRLAYGLKLVRDNLTREEVLTPEQEEQFQRAEDALLKPEVVQEVQKSPESKEETPKPVTKKK